MSDALGVMEVHVPQENVNDDSVTINRWLVKDGAAVQQGQPLVEVETSKADFEIPSPGAGVVRHLAKEGADVPVGAAICLIGASAESLAARELPATAAKHAPVAAAAGESCGSIATAASAVCEAAPAAAPLLGAVATRFSRSAQTLVREHGLNVELFKGRGLMRGEDILEHLGKKPGNPPAASPTAEGTTHAATRLSPQPSIGVPVKIEKLPRSKQMEVRYLRSAYDNVIPSTVCVTAQHFPQPANNGETGFSSVILFEAARLLRQFPLFNAFYAEGHCHYYQEINIGFAVDVGEGLRVPVIRNADRKTLPQIQEEQRELVVQCLSGQLQPQTLSGGTFTVTDLSGEGVSTFVPLINQGQSAILGIAAPHAGESSYELILSFDHQLAEGRTAANFLKELRQRLESHGMNLSGAQAGTAAPAAREIACYRCGVPVKDLPPGHFMLTGYPRNGQSPEPICTVCVQDF